MKKALVATEAVQTKINMLDLDPIKVKLMDKDEGQGWTLAQTNEIEKWYKRFLFLMLKHQDKSIVPNQLVDKFWHQHILDTRKYAEDCQYIFGFFVHHFPYFGMRGQEDEKNLRSSFDETNQIFLREFGEVMPATVEGAGKCNACGQGSCSHSGWCSKCDGGKKSMAVDVINNRVRPTLASVS